jgi:signal transduction histidine kinase
LIHPHDKINAFREVIKHFKKQNIFDINLRLQCKNGDFRLFNVCGQATFDDNDTAIRMIGFISDITERNSYEEDILKMSEDLEEQVNVRIKQLRNLSQELAMTEERERYRLAQDLHDNLGQLLSVIKIKLTTLEPDSLQSSIDAIIGLIDKANESVRVVTRRMNPLILRTLGFFPALEALADEFENEHNLTVRMNFEDNHQIYLCHEILAMLYRSIRELLMNVVKHSKTSDADISVTSNGDQLFVSVMDNGCGFDATKFNHQEHLENTFGLYSVRERIINIGGTFDINSSSGHGTKINMTIPYSV